MIELTAFAALGIPIDLHGETEQRLPCPKCGKGKNDDSLGANIDSGIFGCFRCGWSGRAGNGESMGRPITRIDDASIAARKRKRLRATWRETVPLDHKKAYAVRAYLQTRALGEVLSSPPRVLRAHPALEYWDRACSLGRYPAMVVLFHSAAGEPTTLHCTYLRPDGCAKAAVPAPKKILGVPVRGSTKGGAIHLHEPLGGVLGIAEGVESALSLHLIRKVPVWASYCADNLERIRLPRGLCRLEIGIDIDASGKGRQVAEALGKRVVRSSPGTRVIYILPEIDGPGDLNDELRLRAG